VPEPTELIAVTDPPIRVDTHEIEIEDVSAFIRPRSEVNGATLNVIASDDLPTLGALYAKLPCVGNKPRPLPALPERRASLEWSKPTLERVDLTRFAGIDQQTLLP
jgi:hypothetical protein